MSDQQQLLLVMVALLALTGLLLLLDLRWLAMATAGLLALLYIADLAAIVIRGLPEDVSGQRPADVLKRERDRK